jgi:hypothetical protein
MNTLRMVTKIYTMNKALGSNEWATSKRDSKWMGVEKREWVFGWRVLKQHHDGEGS